MMAEQQMFEGPRCPVRQQFITPRDQWVKEQLAVRAAQERARELNRQFDELAAQSAFMDRYELGIPTL